MNNRHTSLRLYVVVDLLESYNIRPDISYTAVQGEDWGIVSAWYIPQGGERLVMWETWERQGYGLDTDDRPLSSYLIDSKLTGFAHIQNLAEVLGLGGLPEQDFTNCTKFRVLVTLHFEGKRTHTHYGRGATDTPLEFASVEKCGAWISWLECHPQVLLHGERAAPTYTMVGA